MNSQNPTNLHEGHPSAPDGQEIIVRGKFFFRGEEKFFIKGVTYGPFMTGSHGSPLPEREVVTRDFTLMRELGANTVRTFTPPPMWLLDMAAEHDLKVLIGLPWMQHITFLKSAETRKEIRKAVEVGVKACHPHSAVLAYFIGNEIPPDIVRWHGPERIGAFLKTLMQVVKSVAPNTLVSYANFPSTEYLQTDFADFFSFNVYLHNEEKFRKYLSRLQNLAGEKPLVLTEFGIDSIREGLSAQAEILAWQVRASFEKGVAGTNIFSWTDEWHTGGHSMTDWAFGLVDAERRPKASFDAVREQYRIDLPPKLSQVPRVSVIVCAYNAERTLDECLTSLEGLNYPDYEVILVNDGSSDHTAQIASRHPSIRTISQENMGLSEARNVGILASSGEITAFTDADCVVDPDWLTYLIATFLHSGLSAVGGPNLVPPEDSLVPACVAAAPGGPTHVLLSDEVAEHIAGCNMAFRREVFEKVGFFDPHFRTAGDDVDFCWRLQDAGYTIGFSPSAVVWHYRRNSVGTYLDQQRGYGKAEALVYFKHASRFNLLGQTRWLGRIYGDFSASLLSRRPMIYSGVFGRGLFQTLYEPPFSIIAHLPRSLEWNLAGVLVFILSMVSGGLLWLPGSIPLLLSLGTAIAGSMRAEVDPRFRGMRSRLLIAFLICAGPLVRSYERYRWRITGYSGVETVEPAEAPQEHEVALLERAFYVDYWSEDGTEKEALLQGLIDFLTPRKYFITIDQGWNDWDLKISRGIWSRAQIKVCGENHGGPKRCLRTRCALRLSKPAKLALAVHLALFATGLALGLAGLTAVAVVAGVALTAFIVNQELRLGRILCHVTGMAANRAGLIPLTLDGKPSSK